MKYLAILIPLAISITYLTATQLAQPPANLKPKIFVLGLSKTGTTSIGNALAQLGYKRLGWKDIRSRHLVHTFLHGDLAAVTEQTRYFDAFEDLPWPFLYREMAEMYPDARFLLSLREEEGVWLGSLRRHMSRGVWPPAAHFYGVERVEEGSEEVVLNVYRNHTAAVRRYFEDKQDRYAELVIEDDGDRNWEILCRIAECPSGGIPAVDFPKTNTVAHWRDGSLVSKLRWFWGWTIGRIEEVSVSFYYERDWPIVRTILQQMWHLVSVIELAVCHLYFTYAVQNPR